MTARYDYLIIGGGMVADAAARGIREVDEAGSIGILSEDIDEPYARPALSKKLWTDPDFTWEETDLHTARDTEAHIHTRTRVARVDPVRATVETDAGEVFGYGTLLFATGGRPKHIGLPDDDRIIYFRSASDYRRLRGFAASGAHVVVVGGSYIGMELAAALVQNGATVTLAFPDETLGASMFPANLASAFQAKYTEHGVVLRPGVSVTGGEVNNAGITVRLDDGSSLDADVVVSGLGIEPTTALAEAAGLDVRDGIVVDTYLATSLRGIYAAGDVALYPDRILGVRRVEHVDNAKEMGRVAGRAMAGDVAPYTHTPYYYSVVFDANYEAVGTLDASLETVARWDDPLERGIVYYLRDGVAVGVLLWNLAGRTDEARAVLARAGELTREDLMASIEPTDA